MIACARQHYSFGIFAICTSAPSHICMPAGPNGCLPYLRRKLCKRTPRVPHTEITRNV